jgi:CRP-like cAMP-binding protein
LKIENEVFNFHDKCQFEKLQLSELQMQYLADLRGQNSIQQISERYLANGWLLNFKILFELIEVLVNHHWVLNINIKTYFQKLKIGSQSSFNQNQPVPTKIKSHLEKVKEFPFFRSLKSELAEYLISKGRLYTYNAESTICRSGDETRDLYVLISGEAGVYKQASTFKQFVAILSETAVFGEAGFLLGEKRTADVIALKKTEILIIPFQAEILERFLNKDIAQNLQQRFWVQHALLHSDFFKNIPTDCLDALTFTGQIIDLADQQILFNQGQQSDSAFIVIQGSLLVFQNSQLINTLPQGSFLGEVSLMATGGVRTATVLAQRNTKLLEIHRTQFYKLLSHNLYLAKEIQNLADQRLVKDTQRVQRA